MEKEAQSLAAALVQAGFPQAEAEHSALLALEALPDQAGLLELLEALNASGVPLFMASGTSTFVLAAKAASGVGPAAAATLFTQAAGLDHQKAVSEQAAALAQVRHLVEKIHPSLLLLMASCVSGPPPVAALSAQILSQVGDDQLEAVAARSRQVRNDPAYKKEPRGPEFPSLEGMVAATEAVSSTGNLLAARSILLEVNGWATWAQAAALAVSCEPPYQVGDLLALDLYDLAGE